ncbi:MAG TPA: hypothetical protein VGG74_22630 [Kofleriaceae bacterium]|jgi:hypothetical protein
MRLAPWLACLAAGAACRGGGGKKKPTVGSNTAAPFELVNGDDAGAVGPTGDEVEPNDTDDKATPLQLGATMRGKIDPDTDIDKYRIAVAQQGELAVTVSAVDADLALEIEDGSGKVVAKSDRGGVRVAEGVPNLGVSPGSYVAVVRAIKHRSRRGSAESKPPPVYELTAQMVTPAPNAEHEPDDDRGSANELIVGDTGTGFIGWTGDVDAWKTSIEALATKDALDVEVSAVDGVAFELELDDGSGAALLHRKAPRGAPMIVRGFVPPEGSGGSGSGSAAPPALFAVISAAQGSNPETPYTLRISGHVIGADAEIEPDDTPDRAFPWPADRTTVHASWTPGDVDCFALPVSSSARDVTATIEPAGDLSLVVELLVDGKPAGAPTSGGKGITQKLSGSVPANSHAVLRVKGADDRAAEGTYDVTLQDGA